MDNKIQEILIRARKDVFGGNIGDTLTTFKGDGLDFREIKEYEIGDDVKKINWKATAKTHTTKVNVFNVERELNIVVCFLASGSVHFGSVRFKQEVISEIISILSYSTIKNNNILSSLIFSNNDDMYYPPSKGESIVYNTTESVYNFDTLGKQIDYEKLCYHINSTLKQKSIIFLVGDFYSDDKIDLSSIAYKHDVYSLIVRDHFEEYPYISGEFDFVSPVDYGSTFVNMDKKTAKNYQNLLNKNDAQLFEHLEQHKIKSGKIYTNDDIYSTLAQIIKG